MEASMISIVMPTWNRSHYLAESIDSVLRQTYKDWELLVIDDGSTDSTPVLMGHFTKKDKRIKYYPKKHEGIAKTRNYGLKLAKGGYIAVHDSDDFMLPKKLYKSLKRLKETGADFVYSSYFIADGEGHTNGMHEPPTKITIKQVLDNSAWPHITIVAKRKCFDESPYRPELKVNDDAFLMFDWFQRGYKGVRIKEPLNIVRYHNTRISIGKQKEVEAINEKMRKEAE